MTELERLKRLSELVCSARKQLRRIDWPRLSTSDMNHLTDAKVSLTQAWAVINFGGQNDDEGGV